MTLRRINQVEVVGPSISRRIERRLPWIHTGGLREAPAMQEGTQTSLKEHSGEG